MLKIFQLLPRLDPLQEGVYVFWQDPIILWAFSYFLVQDAAGSFYLSWPSPGISDFSKEFWFLFSRESKLDLNARCAHCSWSVTVPRPTQWTQLENICMCIHSLCACEYACTHTYTHIYLFLYLPIFYPYIANHKFTLILPILIQCHKIHASVLPSVSTFVTTFSNSEKPSSYCA